MSTNLKLITGYTAEAHITPNMDAQWHSAINGADTFVYDYGQCFAASANQAMSQIRISDGVGQIQGRFFIIEESLIETVDYPNTPPEVGLTRIDTVLLHWGTSTKIVNGTPVTVNTCEFEYKKNPLANGQPEAFPETNLNLGDTDAYFPMWHVEWNENGLQTITPIFYILCGGGVISVSIPSISALPLVHNDERIRKRHKATTYYLSNPSAQTGDWTATPANGSVTITGDINGTTDLVLDFYPTLTKAEDE